LSSFSMAVFGITLIPLIAIFLTHASTLVL
jgi:hypothetical protein